MKEEAEWRVNKRDTERGRGVVKVKRSVRSLNGRESDVNGTVGHFCCYFLCQCFALCHAGHFFYFFVGNAFIHITVTANKQTYTSIARSSVSRSLFYQTFFFFCV